MLSIQMNHLDKGSKFAMEIQIAMGILDVHV